MSRKQVDFETFTKRLSVLGKYRREHGRRTHYRIIGYRSICVVIAWGRRVK